MKLAFLGLFLAATLAAETLDERIASVLPSQDEDRWLEVPWRRNVMLARAEAQASGRPIVVWIMDGNVLGCT